MATNAKWHHPSPGNISGPDTRGALSGLNVVHCIAVDIPISGSGETIADAERDHDWNLIAFLLRCQHKGLKLNRSKLRLNRE